MKKALLGLALLGLSGGALAHKMKHTRVVEHSFTDTQTISMTVINGPRPMSYKVVVDGEVRGSIGRELAAFEEFPFYVTLNTPVNSTTEYRVCTLSEPVNGHLTQLCGSATLSRY